MNGDTKEGGYAFPQYTGGGMSLRDWFAGQALAGLLAGNYRDSNHHNLAEVPAEAYHIADAMLAAGKVQP